METWAQISSSSLDPWMPLATVSVNIRAALNTKAIIPYIITLNSKKEAGKDDSESKGPCLVT